MKINDRALALKCLTQVIQQKKPLSSLLNSQQASPLTRELCYGVCRYWDYLAEVMSLLMKKPPKELALAILLRLGLYQLIYMRQPEYAVVKETVGLLEKSKLRWAKGLVNAVLREYGRQATAIQSQLAQNPKARFNHPEWLMQKLQAAWPTQWEGIMAQNNAHAPMTLRVNHQKTTVPTYLDRLAALGMTAHAHPLAPQAIILEQACDVQDLPGFADGLVSVQDAAAQLAAGLLDLQPGQVVLDACAAPGGKTCHMLEIEPALQACVAVDQDPQRLSKIEDNLQRLGLQARLIAQDATLPTDWSPYPAYDRILLDAPCSATGVIRRHPEIKILRQPEEIAAIVAVQAQLLQRLWPLLKSGGRLLYATCSILPEENEAQIKAFLQQQPDAQARPIDLPLAHRTAHGLQILPGELEMDGFFYALLQKG